MASLEANLTLIGGPTVLIEFSGLRLLTDPTFDEPGTYEAAGIVLEKKRGPAFSIDALGVIDAVLLSHDQHFDNFDRTGRTILVQAKNTFTPLSGAKRLGGSVTGLSPMGNHPPRGFKRTAALRDGYARTARPGWNRTPFWRGYRLCAGNQ